MNHTPYFNNPRKGQLTLKEVVLELRDFIKETPDAYYTLVVGTDSRGYKNEADFVSAVVIHRKGSGGRYFWQRTNGNRFYTLRDKIYHETLLSLELAQELVPKLKTSLNSDVTKYNLEIHVDVGEHGESREMLKEVVGMVRGNGFECKTKPDSYGAFVVADKHT